MPVLIVGDLPGGTAEQDEDLMRELGVDNPPPGSLMRLAGPTASGWRVVTLWESEEAFQKFRREKLEPAFARRGMQPKIEVWTPQSARGSVFGGQQKPK